MKLLVYTKIYAAECMNHNYNKVLLSCVQYICIFSKTKENYINIVVLKIHVLKAVWVSKVNLMA